jgi:hypothetical protein
MGAQDSLGVGQQRLRDVTSSSYKRTWVASNKMGDMQAGRRRHQVSTGCTTRCPPEAEEALGSRVQWLTP